MEKEPFQVVAEISKIDFPEAAKVIAKGKKVTKKEWNNENQFAYLAHGFLCIHTDEDHKWNVNDGDLAGEDYYVLEEKMQ